MLRHRDFRNLFLGQSLSAHALPLVGLILLGGVVADRIPRARVMIASDLARFALHARLERAAPA